MSGLDGLGGGAGWADAGIIVPWTIWRVYGDRRIVERHWDADGAVARLAGENQSEGAFAATQLGNNYGDWLCIPSDREFPNALAHEDAAGHRLLGGRRGKDGAHGGASWAGRRRPNGFEAMQERVREAFQKEWLRARTGRLTVETQTAYLLALAFNLLPEAVRDRAAEHLVENIRKLDWHLSTGFIGIKPPEPDPDADRSCRCRLSAAVQ